MMKKCKNCNGVGYIKIAPYVKGLKVCPVCNGTGKINKASHGKEKP